MSSNFLLRPRLLWHLGLLWHLPAELHSLAWREASVGPWVGGEWNVVTLQVVAQIKLIIRLSRFVITTIL